MRCAIFKNLAVTLFLLALSLPALFAQATPIEPAKSFPDIPQLARSSSEVKARYGPLTNADGKPDKGDKLTQKVNQRLFRWHKDLNEQAAAQAMSSQGMMGAGAMGADAGRMIGLLQTNAANLTAEFQKDQQAYAQARGQLDGRYKKKVNQIQAAYEKKEVQGGCYGSTPNYTINCQAVAQQGDDAILKAGDTYLENLAPVYSDMRAKMKHIATQSQSVLDQVNKAFGGHPPFIARMMSQRLTITAMIALAATNSAENDAVVLVYQESVKGPQITF